MKPFNPIAKDISVTLRFILPAFLTLILGKVLFELLAFNFDELSLHIIESFSTIDKTSSIIKFNEIHARLLWLTSILVYFFIVASLTVFTADILRKALTKTALINVIILIIAVSSVETIYFLNTDYTQSPMLSIFNFTFSALSESGLFNSTELFIIKTTVDIVNFLTIIIPLFIVSAVCCLLYEKPNTALPSPHYFLKKSGVLKKLLTGASALMVIGTIHLQLWMHWPLTFIEDALMAIQLKAITLSVCQYCGVAYTLAIPALYLPAATYLSDQAKISIETGTDEEIKKNPSQWLIKNKMLVSPIAQLPQIVAVIAPMLVGSIAPSFSGLVSF